MPLRPEQRGHGDPPERNRSIGADEILTRVATEVVKLLPAATGAAVELAAGEDMVYVAVAGELAPWLGYRVPREGSMSGRALTARGPLASDDTEVDERVDREACRAVGARSMLCLPLRATETSEMALGVLKVTSRLPGAFDEEDVAVLSRLAGFLATVMSGTRTIQDSCDLSAGAQQGLDRFVANVLTPELLDARALRRRIEECLTDRALRSVVQPIVVLSGGGTAGPWPGPALPPRGTTVAVEVLSRFERPPGDGPDRWFALAHSVGLGVELELLAIEVALETTRSLPASMAVALNAGPATITSGVLSERLAEVERPLILELTEHEEIEERDRFRAALATLRQNGVRLSIDDAGVGFAGLSRIVELCPDVIKLDRVLVAGLDLDPVRRALGRALVAFGEETGALVVAEGIETPGELDAALAVGTHLGQGYLLGRPVPVDEVDLGPRTIGSSPETASVRRARFGPDRAPETEPRAAPSRPEAHLQESRRAGIPARRNPGAL